MLFGMLLGTPQAARRRLGWFSRKVKNPFSVKGSGTTVRDLSHFFEQINADAPTEKQSDYAERYEDASHELIADSFHSDQALLRSVGSFCTFGLINNGQKSVGVYEDCEGTDKYIEFMNDNPPQMAWDFDAKTGFDLGKSFWEMNQFTDLEEGWVKNLHFDFLKDGVRKFKEYFSVDLANLSCASVVGAFAILLWIIPGMWYTASIGGVGFMAAQYSYFRLTDTYTRYKNDESQLISNHEWIETVVGGACIAWPVVIWCAMQFSSLAPGSMTNIFSCFF